MFTSSLLKTISVITFLTLTLTLTPTLTLTTAALADEQPESDWLISIGGGVAHTPDYEGSDEYETSFIPNVEIVWKERVSLSLDGLMIDALQGENYVFGAGIGLTSGRDESANNTLRGLGDIDTSVSGRLYASYSLGFIDLGAAFSQDLGDGHEGATLELDASVIIPVIDDELELIVGPNATWASDNYMQSFFGISGKQAANSVHSAYQANAGFKDVGLHATAHYSLTEQVSLVGFANYSRIIGDAADSPLVKNEGSENQAIGGLLLNYSF